MRFLKIKNSNEQVEVGKIVCVGRNYAKHAEELGNEIPEFPLIFLKPASVLISDNENIIKPKNSGELHHEVELVLLIGETIKDADETQAENAIAGYAVGLDMTLRDIQSELKKKGHPWTLAKVFDTSAVISEFVSKKDYQLSGNEKIELYINDEIKQSSSLDFMLFNSTQIVAYLSSKFTLEKGDLIFTGTPEGVGAVNIGDEIKAEIENIGKLKLKVE
ncbi:MAG: fumarylacetoacetate hydrolase family protein [Melioribacteraceae bacterium]|jgi:5-carboxymethyl-2-hydroxymuconate isomerase|nr:MAG: fumarylacetoacetate hydrolase family protein [Ignavibacteriales bacterium]WKZ69815.1 MAG: fumarylacetoacetate hydrolase family protein [Melioribacteraceae bacterium]